MAIVVFVILDLLIENPFSYHVSHTSRRYNPYSRLPGLVIQPPFLSYDTTFDANR